MFKLNSFNITMVKLLFSTLPGLISRFFKIFYYFRNCPCLSYVYRVNSFIFCRCLSLFFALSLSNSLVPCSKSFRLSLSLRESVSLFFLFEAIRISLIDLFLSIGIALVGEIVSSLFGIDFQGFVAFRFGLQGYVSILIYFLFPLLSMKATMLILLSIDVDKFSDLSFV